MIVTLAGNSSFELRRRLDELVSKFVAQQSELALERIEAGNLPSQDIIDAVQSLPFLAERKMVVVRDLAGNKAAAEAVEQIIDSTENTTDLIFYEPATDKRTVYYKTLKQKTQLETYDELSPQELPKWLVSQAAKAGAELSIGDASHLVERVGPDQAMLASELEKLMIYEPKISRQNIDLLTDQAPQGKIFDLLDAAFGGNKKRALKLYEEQRAQRVEPQIILTMLAWQLQLLALAKHAKSRNPSEIAKDTGMSSYPLTKAKSLASKIDDNELNMMVNQALDIDWRSKSTGLDLDEALKTYITTL